VRRTDAPLASVQSTDPRVAASDVDLRDRRVSLADA
jgi:hypothetical protein